MKRVALPAAALALVVAGCSDGPRNPAELAAPALDVTVTGTPDTLPPALVAFDITPDTLVIDTAPGMVTFDFRFVDDTGAIDVVARLLAPDSTRTYCWATLVDSTPQNQQWVCSLVVPDSARYLGWWYVEAVQVHGIGPDSLPGVPSSLLDVWTTSELASLGFQTWFVVMGGGSGTPPGNDTFSNATVVTIPFSEVLNTTEATTDADDAQLNASCGAPATDASVWYTLTPAADALVVVDVWQSGYSAGVLVGLGTPGNLGTVACGHGAVSFYAAAGSTYYVLAIDDQYDGGGNGGTLRISFSEIATTTLDAFTVNRFGKFDARTGIATISGTYACNHGDWLQTSVDARQDVGRFTIFGSGSFFDYGTCDGAPHAWAATVYPQNGRFAGGHSMTVTFAYTCGAINCAYGYVEQTVVLRGGKK